jgi:hypothetical protein
VSNRRPSAGGRSSARSLPLSTGATDPDQGRSVFSRRRTAPST